MVLARLCTSSATSRPRCQGRARSSSARRCWTDRVEGPSDGGLDCRCPSGAASLALGGPGDGDPGAVARQPAGPGGLARLAVRVRQPVVDDDGAARLEVALDASQGLPVAVASAPDAEDAAHEDGAVGPRQLELVDRLRAEPRREAALRGPGPRERHHVGRDVRPVDVEPRRRAAAGGSAPSRSRDPGPARRTAR